jgi:hypothetical protein
VNVFVIESDSGSATYALTPAAASSAATSGGADRPEAEVVAEGVEAAGLVPARVVRVLEDIARLGVEGNARLPVYLG